MYSVVIIDDETLVRTMISDFVQSQLKNFSVAASFSDGDEALEYLSAHSVDVVVTDIRMFRVSGLDVARYVYEHCPETAVIIISGYSEFDYARQSIRYGVKNYILKPIDFEELSQCFSEIYTGLTLRQPVRNSAESDNGGLFLISAFSGIFQNEEELRELAQQALPFSVDYTPIIIVSVFVEKSPAGQVLNQDKLSPVIERQLINFQPSILVYFLWGRGLRYFFVLTCPDLDVQAVCQEIYRNTGLFVSIQILYRADSVLEMIRRLPDEWFGHCMRESLLPSDSSTPPVSVRMRKKSLLVQQAKEYIQSHYMHDISREDVAASIFISPSYFSHIFTEITGMTYMEYLTKIRIEKSIELLRENRKIDEVAGLVGYQSRKPFLVNFREYTSCSPREFLLKYPRKETEK